MKKMKVNKKAMIIIAVMVPVLLTAFIVHEIVNRDIIAVKNIVTDYASVDANSFADVYNNIFHLSDIRVENGERQLSIGFESHTGLSDLLPHIADMRDRVNEYVRSSALNDKIDNVYIIIENHSNWIVRMWTVTDEIVVGADWRDLEECRLTHKDVLGFCRNFEDIYIGGYWGGVVRFDEPIDKEFFSGFTKTKKLKIDDIGAKYMAVMLYEASADLRERGAEVTLYYDRIRYEEEQ